MILPLLPVRNLVLFPGIAMPITVDKPIGLAAVDAALASEERFVVVAAQRNLETEEPRLPDLHTVATQGTIKKTTRSHGQMEVIIQGSERVDIVSLVQTSPFIRARAAERPYEKDDPEALEALRRELMQRVGEIQGLMHVVEPDIGGIVSQFHDPFAQVYLLASILNLDAEREQSILEADSAETAMKMMHSYLLHEENILKLRQKISKRAAREMGKDQREYYLHQQLRAIQEELGETKPEEAEINTLRSRLRDADLPEHARAEASAQLERLARLTPMAPDYQVIRSHLDLIVELPWRRSTVDSLDLARARQVLDEDHYNLKDIKERIVEHLAVLKLNPGAKAPILCLVGPPGVGKTSLGQSIARALGRRFERMSLGGLHDEAELRGHRRTYVGAMPGRLIQAVRRAAANNPVLMLDEIDKLGQDFRGDPAAALMEVLDPAQNSTFRDNYLDLPFDLSKIFFITTANSLDSIPAPLLDRMEVLRLSGYTEDEKFEIARRYLVPRQLEQSGLRPDQLRFDESAIRRVIERYTREAGVRQLERELGSLTRKIALRVAQGAAESIELTDAELTSLLGPERFFADEARRDLKPGAAAGLAWTEAGGEVLYIEATLLPGREGLTMTGHLGDVMKESVQTALGYVWSRHPQAPGDLRHGRRTGIHVHVPAGAVPKDGPSAGVAIAAAVASLYSGVPARSDTAMTGEVTLSGLVLPVGGIKEKVLAARRAQLKRVILPKANEKDLGEIPTELRRQIEVILVDDIDQALNAALPGLAARAAW